MEDREIRMQAQINRLEIAHARVAEHITDDFTTRSSNPAAMVKPHIKYGLSAFKGAGSPMRHLSKLKQHWKVVRPRACVTEYLIK